MDDDQVRHFRERGYLVTDQLIAESDVAAIGDEVRSSLADAFGTDTKAHLDTYLRRRGGRRSGAVLGQYLPLMADHTPISRALIESDELIGAARKLLGSDGLVVKPPKAVCYVDPTFWHHDTELPAVKMVVYVDAEEDVTLDVVPGSHDPQKRPSVDGDADLERERLRVTVPVPIGHVLLFDTRLWHRNQATTRRLQWSVTYMPEPKNEDDVASVVKALGSFFDKHPAYDEDRYPFFPASWVDGTSTSQLAECFRRSGVASHLLALHGARLGAGSEVERVDRAR